MLTLNLVGYRPIYFGSACDARLTYGMYGRGSILQAFIKGGVLIRISTF